MLQNPKASGRLRSVRVGRTLRSANFQAGRPEDSESNRSARSTLRASAERSPARDPKSSPVPCRCTGVTAAAYSPPSRASASQGCQASRDRWTQIPGCLAGGGRVGGGAKGGGLPGPRLTALGRAESAVLPPPSWPYWLRPQHSTPPPPSSAHVWDSPAVSATAAPPPGPAGACASASARRGDRVGCVLTANESERAS